ncbi:S8 family peptidase [Burkholderia pseudomultivorans]|uniref:S8 family peptidase n=1 Tax=Burkholderia pseudomultivorans TaxID=1207504 RepID=UPI0007543905|nr:S8 family peptidase [Burkholderia pseudomultivorans]KWF02634.1 peptidase S8 [Burkholderia pseudomultivorans]
MAERNLLLGGGEKLATVSEIKRGSGPKKRPYQIADTRAMISNSIVEIEEAIRSLPDGSKPRGEGVFQLTLHPAFLARSYYPVNLMRASGLRDVGSREATVVPRKVTNPRDEGKQQATASLYVAGSADDVQTLWSLLQSDRTPAVVQQELTEIESIDWIAPEEKFKGALPEDAEQHSFEVALHAGSKEEDIVAAFAAFAKKSGARADLGRRIQVGGLTFVPVRASPDAMRKLTAFTFLRVARPMPAIRAAIPNVVRQSQPDIVCELPPPGVLDASERVAIFDGGLGTDDLNPWVKEIVFDDTKSTHGQLLMHGNEVTSTFLFGRPTAKSTKLPQPFLAVDHYRVLSPASGRDPDLFDVLLRIKAALDTGDYKFANFSLGPHMPIDDGEVHAWTATLDQLCARYGIFATVAVGNDGEAEGANRIQPPGDMVNALAVGAADSSGVKWKRAKYSCVGPGRSPGYVKPDGVAFGGSDAEPFAVFNPLLGSVVGVQGTSYSAPLALRTAAGVDASTTLELSSIALKALMVHHAERSRSHKREEVGWGRFKESMTGILECAPETVTVIFQATLAKGEYRRCPIPFPDVALPGAVEIKATFCLHADTDPEHAVNYTRSGMGVVFRPRFGLNEADTTEFFGMDSQYTKTERQLRDGAHKWETTLHRRREFREPNSLVGPVFDVEYHAREAGRSVRKIPSAPDVSFALVVTIKAEGVTDIYNLVRQKYRVLLPVELRVGVDLSAV